MTPSSNPMQNPSMGPDGLPNSQINVPTFPGAGGQGGVNPQQAAQHQSLLMTLLSAGAPMLAGLIGGPKAAQLVTSIQQKHKMAQMQQMQQMKAQAPPAGGAPPMNPMQTPGVGMGMPPGTGGPPPMPPPMGGPGAQGSMPE